MFEQIKGMLAESFGLDPETIQSESRLEADLGINSLELAELALRCDEEFGVDIDEDDIHRLITVGDVAAYIEEKKAEGIYGCSGFKKPEHPYLVV